MVRVQQGWSPGAITFLMTDIVGSTRLWEQAPDEMDAALQRHDAIVTAAVDAVGGELIRTKGEGDSTFSVFAEAGQAATAALAVNRALRAEPWPEPVRIAVRMAMHTGGAVPRDGDYYGSAVNRTARLRAVAGGDQILVSGTTAELLAPDLPAGAVLVNLGVHPLKDVAGPEEIHALVGAGETVGVLEVGRAADDGDALPRALAAVAPVLVGRERERRQIEEALAAARQGNGAVVLVEGEAGIGKTALVAAAAREAREAGTAVLYGRCEAGAVPYQPFADALEPWVAAAPLGTLAAHVTRFGMAAGRLVPALRARMATLGEAPDATPEVATLHAAVVDLVAAASVPGALLFVIEDLHAADDTSVALLRHLLRAPAASSVCLVLSHRGPSEGRSDPCAGLLDALATDPGVRRLSLEGLDETAATALVELSAGRALTDGGRALAARLAADTAGNPYLVLEVLRHLVAEGEVDDVDGSWGPSRPLAELTIPVGVRELLTNRVTALGPEVADALRSAAVLGATFEFETLARVAAIGEEDLLDALERAEGAGLVTEAELPGSFAFTHGLVLQALYDGMGAERRRRRHRAVALALIDQWGTDPSGRAGEIARHWIAGAGREDRTTVLDWTEAAAEEALLALAPDQATSWLAEAERLLSAGAPDPHRPCRLQVLAGEAQRMAGDPAYRATLLAAAADAQALGDTGSLVRAALANTRGLLSRSGAVDHERVAVLRAALDAVGEGDSPQRARLLGLLAVELDDDPDWQRTEQLGRDGQEMAARLGDPVIVLHSLVHSGAGWRPHTLADRRRRIIPTAAALATELGDPYAGFFAASTGMASELQAGEAEAARHHLARMEELADQYPEPTLRWLAVIFRGAMDLMEGDMARAEALAEEALALGAACGQPDAGLWYAGQIGAVRIQQGRSAELVPLLRMIAEGDPDNRSLHCTLAFCLAEIGETTEAGVLLGENARDDFAGIPYSGVWLLSLGLSGLTAAALGDRRIGEIVTRKLAPFEDQVIVAGVSISGPVAYTLGRLALLREDLDEADRLLGRAHATAVGLPSPHVEASASQHWAEVAGRRGDEATQRERLTAAVEIGRRHGFDLITERSLEALDAIGAPA